MRGNLLFKSTFFCTLIILSACLNNDDAPPDFAEQLEKDIAAIDAYLAANNIEVQQDLSGIRYVIHRVGAGSSPSLSNCVTTNYTGKFLKNNQTFDQGGNVSFRVQDVIYGWQIGLQLLHQGDSATLYIPSGYAYGPSGSRSIPGNANLFFGVELLHVGTTYNSILHSCD